MPPFKKKLNLSMFNVASEEAPSEDSPAKLDLSMFAKEEKVSPEQALPVNSEISEESFKVAADADFGDSLKHVARSFGSGLSFGLADNKYTAEDPALRYAGYAANITGSILSGLALSATGIGAIGAIGRGAQATQKAATAARGVSVATKALAAAGRVAPEAAKLASKAAFKAGAKNIGMQTAAAVQEGVLIGAVGGAIKSGLEGNDIGEIIKDSAATSLQFAAGAALATPVLGAALAPLSGRKILGKVKKSAEIVAKDDEAFGAVSSIAKKDLTQLGVAPDEIARITGAAKKVSELKPFLSEAELIANPEILAKANKEFIQQAGEQAFKGEGAPFASLVQADARLKEMVDSGDFVAAFAAVRGATKKAIGMSKPLAEWTTAPFVNDANILRNAKLNQIKSKLTKVSPDDNIDDVFRLIDEGAKPGVAMKGISEQAKPQVYRQIRNYKSNNIRLSKEEVNATADEIISDALNSIADRKVTLQQSAKLKNTEALFDALVTFNKPLQGKIFQQIVAGRAIEEQHVNIPAHLADAVENINAKRVLEDSVAARMNEISKINAKLKTNPVNAKELQDRSISLYKEIYSAKRRIRTIDNSLPRNTPEYAEAVKVADTVWRPSYEGMAAVSTGTGIGPEYSKVTNKILENYFKWDSSKAKRSQQRFGVDPAEQTRQQMPWAIKEGSELADFLHGLLLTDYQPAELTKFSFLNPQRRLAKEFGMDNPIQKILFEPIKEAEINIRAETARLQSEVRGLKVKAGSKLSAIVQRLGEKTLKKTDDEFINLSAEDQKTATEAVEYLNSTYKQFIHAINEVHKKNSFPLIPERENYFHHFADDMELTKEGLKKFFNGEAIDAEPGKLFRITDSTTLNRTLMSAEKKRTGGEFVNDAIGGFERYMESALKRIHYSDLTRHADTAATFAPANFGKYLQDLRDGYLIGFNPKDMGERPMFSRAATSLVNEVRRLTSQGTLLGTASTALTQMTGFGLNAAMGGKHALKAMLAMRTKEGQRLLSQSKNVILRSNPVEEGFAHQESLLSRLGVTKKMKGWISDKSPKMGAAVEKGSEAFKIYKKATAKALGFFDKGVAKAAFLTGVYKGRAMGMTDEQAVRLGDWFAGATQAEMTKIGQPEFMATPIGKALGQYQSFTINLFATVYNDLPQIAQSEGASAAMSMLMKGVAGTMISNAILNKAGVPAEMNTESMIPWVSSTRFGVPGAIGAIKDAADIAVGKAYGDRRLEAKGKKGLSSKVVAMTGIPGAVQLKKSLEGAAAAKEDGVDKFSEDWVQYIVFGKTKGRELKDLKPSQESNIRYNKKKRSVFDRAFKK